VVREKCSYKPESEVISKEVMMKTRKFLILLIGVFAIVAMLVSCTAHKRPGFTFPSTPSTQAPQITTTTVEVTGQPDEEGVRGKLKVHFDPGTGKCSSIEVNGVRATCTDEKLTIPLEKTYICTPRTDDKHPANTQINNVDVYCGNIIFLTEGADYRFKEDSTARNYECKNVGGHSICF
jgi:hypothetical protein